nr:unnamed protein product [Digitaria exilis]
MRRRVGDGLLRACTREAESQLSSGSTREPELRQTAAAAAQTTMIDSASAVCEFSVNYEQAKHQASVQTICSDAISAGGHMRRIRYYASTMSENICIGLERLSKQASIGVKVIFEVLLIDKDGIPAVVAAEPTLQYGIIVSIDSSTAVSSTDLGKKYVKDGQIKFLCTIKMLNIDDTSVRARTSGKGIPVPPSDIVQHLGTLLDTADGTDLTFTIDGETFNAHRAILAARSPVFRAELLGSMAEATMTSITLHDTAPATFKAMLRFMYTDALPKEDELGDSPLEEMFEHLLAAADRYALDRLKLLCAQKLWDNVSVDTVATTLACAQMYNCLELKEKCISFFMVDKHFKKAVLTEGFVKLMQQDPSIIIELRDRTQT